MVLMDKLIDHKGLMHPLFASDIVLCFADDGQSAVNNSIICWSYSSWSFGVVRVYCIVVLNIVYKEMCV